MDGIAEQDLRGKAPIDVRACVRAAFTSSCYTSFCTHTYFVLVVAPVTVCRRNRPGRPPFLAHVAVYAECRSRGGLVKHGHVAGKGYCYMSMRTASLIIVTFGTLVGPSAQMLPFGSKLS